MEVIVVDDGSTDETPECARQHPLSPKVIVLPENVGPGAARNRAAEHAEGEFLVFLDSDDAMLPWAMGTFAAALAEYPACDVLLLPVRTPDEPGDETTLKRADRSCMAYARYVDAARDGVMFATGHCTIRKKRYLEAGGLTETVRVCEDLDLGFRLSEDAVVLVDAPVCVARYQVEGRVTANVTAWREGMLYLEAQERSGQYPGGDQSRHKRSWLMMRSWRALTIDLARSGARMQALSDYLARLWLHLRHGGIKFVVGFPLWWCVNLVSGEPKR